MLGKIPKFPGMVVAPVLVTIEPARTAKLDTEPSVGAVAADAVPSAEDRIANIAMIYAHVLNFFMLVIVGLIYGKRYLRRANISVDSKDRFVSIIMD